MNINIGRAIFAGIIGTIAMTAVGLWVAPLMGIPPMNPANMVAGAMGGVLVLGWAAHFGIGSVLAVVYSAVASAIPGSPAAAGALYGVAPWLLAQVVVMPMMGMPLFSGSAAMAIGSLIGHLVYGGVVGAAYGSVPATRATRAEGSARA